MITGLLKEIQEMNTSLNGERSQVMTLLHTAYREQMKKLSGQSVSEPTEEEAQILLSQLDPGIQKMIKEFFAPFLPFIMQALEVQRLVIRWDDRKTTSPPDFIETDREHVIGLLLIACQIRADLPNLFTTEEWRDVFTLILIHDLPEVFGGDISRKNPLHKSSSPYRHLREVAALRIMLREFSKTSPEHQLLASQILQLFTQYETKPKSDIESRDESQDELHQKTLRFVRWLDVYQGNQIAIEHYDNLKQTRSVSSVANMRKKITDMALDPLTKRTKKFTGFLEDPDQIDYFATLALNQLRDYSEAGYHRQVKNYTLLLAKNP